MLARREWNKNFNLAEIEYILYKILVSIYAKVVYCKAKKILLEVSVIKKINMKRPYLGSD